MSAATHPYSSTAPIGPGPDDELIRLCARAEAARAEMNRVYTIVSGMTLDEEAARQDEIDAVAGAYFGTAAKIHRYPARTPAGTKARARALLGLTEG